MYNQTLLFNQHDDLNLNDSSKFDSKGESININQSMNECDSSNIQQLDGNITLSTLDSTGVASTLSFDAYKKTSNFRIIEANVNSLKGKKEEVKAMLEKYKPDCVVLVETKLDESYKNSELFDVDKWNIVIREDKIFYGGGIIIAVLRKDEASPVNITYDNEEENPELYWIKLNSIKNQKPVYICGFYRSQRDNRSKNTINCLEESLLKLPGKKGQQHVVIIGDANLHIDWETNQPQLNSFTKILDEKMIILCNKFNLTQKVNFPTRLENTLDILLTSDPSKVVNVEPAPPLADHDLVIGDFEFCVKKKPKSQHIIYNWNKADTEGICKYVTDKLGENSFKKDDDIDTNWEKFKNIMLEARDKFVPHRLTTSRHNLPWYTRTLRRLGNKKQRLNNKARK